MPVLTLTKNYEDATLLLEDDFNVFLDEVEALLNTTKLDGDNILDAGITANLKILSNTTTAAKVQANAVTTVKVEDEGVDTTQINTSAVTTAKLADSAVTSAKVAASAITNAKLAASSVTEAKFSYTTDINASNISDTTATIGGATVYTLSVAPNTEKTSGASSIVSTGRPILIALTAKQPDASSTFTDVSVGSTTSDITFGQPSMIRCQKAGDFVPIPAFGGVLTLNRDGTPIYSTVFTYHSEFKSVIYVEGLSDTDTLKFPSGMIFIDQPAAGSYTYSVSIESSYTYCTVDLVNTQLNVMEL